MLKIGKLKLDSDLILAPMAGYSDIGLRVLCRRAGAGLVCSEMVHSSALLHGNAKTKAMTRIVEEERPVCVQLFGTKPEDVKKACREFEGDCDVVGFNFGCPAQQIKSAGCGAALLDHPDVIEAIVAALRSSTDKPLLPKMRLGNMALADYVRIAKRIEAAGADALIVHGRTAKQGYSGKADWAAIGEIKRALSIPVIANGDVVDGPSAKACLAASGADGIAIGRAALGDPDVFRRIATYLKDGTVLPNPTPDEKMALWKEYEALAKEAGISRQQILQQAMSFTKGIPGAARMRERLAKGR